MRRQLSLMIPELPHGRGERRRVCSTRSARRCISNNQAQASTHCEAQEASSNGRRCCPYVARRPRMCLWL